MKKIIAAIAVSCYALLANAQVFDQGTSVFTIGYGFPNYITIAAKAVPRFIDEIQLEFSDTQLIQAEQNVRITGLGPVIARYEYALHENFGLGGSFGYGKTSASFDYTTLDIDNELHTYSHSASLSYFGASIRANGHLNLERVDPYLGIGFGYTQYFFRDKGNNPYYKGSNYPVPGFLGIEGSVGARFYITENIGAYAEIGFVRWSLINAGLAVRF
jgi:hypothetical protein